MTRFLAIVAASIALASNAEASATCIDLNDEQATRAFFGRGGRSIVPSSDPLLKYGSLVLDDQISIEFKKKGCPPHSNRTHCLVTIRTAVEAARVNVFSNGQLEFYTTSFPVPGVTRMQAMAVLTLTGPPVDLMIGDDGEIYLSKQRGENAAKLSCTSIPY